MSVKFSVHERMNPRDKSALKLFYPIAKSSGSINLKQIGNRIAAMSTVNQADVLAVLDLLVQVMREELAEGNIVKLSDFGSFSITINGTGSAKAEEVTASNIKNANLRFRPGPDLSNMLLTLKFEKEKASTGEPPKE